MSSPFDRFSDLPEFPFRRLAALLEGVEPAAGREVLDLTVGEPKHAPPAMLSETVLANAGSWNRYPPPSGTDAFRNAVARWLTRRYGLPPAFIDPVTHIVPLAGTKEGLFLLPSVVNGKERAVALMPSPLYAVYAGAAALADAEPVGLPAIAEHGFLPDLDALDPQLLDRTVVFFLCSPANPQGAIASGDYLARVVELARRHDFLFVSDECYSEIYDDAPPVGVLEVLAEMGEGMHHVVAMHSLSKRSNAAGLRSGFVAGDAAILRRFARLRAYGGAVQPLPVMEAATRLWDDEEHVRANRERYRRKIDIAERKLGNRFAFYRPAGGFFLWLDVGDGEAATRRLWREAALKVLPGSYLTFGDPGDGDMGKAYIRMALVHDEAIIGTALDRLVDVLG
ncbi:MAG: aminotransferase class I/II-fold pyridoxal phosphate-dependent enzyme [Geminicoccaceae bacterium]|nr:aminotransferase class I/II-fold pyridoxal phosphate-dependent enzyme [Geminicoccaceae bacterium]